MAAIPDHPWQPIRDHRGAPFTEEQWARARAAVPVGSLVTGTVLACLPMGIFVGLADRVIGQVEVVAFDPADLLWVDRADIPPVGSSITARVVGYSVGQQVRLSLRSEDLSPST